MNIWKPQIISREINKSFNLMDLLKELEHSNELKCKNYYLHLHHLLCERKYKFKFMRVEILNQHVISLKLVFILFTIYFTTHIYCYENYQRKFTIQHINQLCIKFNYQFNWTRFIDTVIKAESHNDITSMSSINIILYCFFCKLSITDIIKLFILNRLKNFW